MRTRLNIIVVVLVAATSVLAAQVAENETKQKPEKVSYLDPGSIIDYQPLTRHRGFFESDLRIYCYNGVRKTLGRLFESVELQLDIEGDDYTQYEGLTPAEVREHHDQQRSLFSFSLFSQKRTRLQLSPFAQQCIGIETVQPYRVRLQQLRLDFWRLIQLVVGVTLFVYAGQLSHNAVFYYITGVALGICSSFMLLIWLSSKLVPRRTMMYGVLIGGWTIGLYIIQMLWENLQVIVLTYRSYVFWYILVTGLLSFFFCYRLGPPKNKRSKNIIKWVLQLMSLVLIYFSSYFEEATAAIIILTIVMYYFPRSLVYRTRAFYLSRFPPKRRMLSSEEYYEQGVRETTKALEELRSYASSPDCKQWKVMSKLRDPLRFAAFVEGASHLRDEEILHFDAKHDDELDESEYSIDENEEEHEAQQYQNAGGGDASYIYHRIQQEQLQRRSLPRIVHNQHPELSDDDDEEDVVEVATTSNRSYNRHHTPLLNTSNRHLNKDVVSSGYAPRTPRQRTVTRSKFLPDSAKHNNGSAQHNLKQRSNYNDESDDY